MVYSRQLGHKREEGTGTDVLVVRGSLEHLQIFFGSQVCQMPLPSSVLQKGMEELSGGRRVFLMKSRMTLWSELRRRIAGL